MSESIDHPNHYNHGTVEAITVIDDLLKAEWYIHHEIERLSNLEDN